MTILISSLFYSSCFFLVITLKLFALNFSCRFMQPQVAENGMNPAHFQGGGNADVYYSSRNYPPATVQSGIRSASVSALHYGEVQPQQNPLPPQQQQFYQQQRPPQQQLPNAHHASLVQLNQPQQPPTATEPAKNPSLMRGWLHHWEGWPLKYWHKRWAVLRLGTLNIYKSSTSDKLLNSFLLHNYQIAISGRDDKNYRRFAFRCEAPGLKTLYFATDTEQDMNDWIRTLQSAVQPMGTFHSHPQQMEQSQQQPAPADVGDYSQNAKTLPYQRQMLPPPNLGIPPAATMNYQPQPQLQQQQQMPMTGYYGYKQSPPLPPPVRFPPPPPQQQQQQQPLQQHSFAYNQQQQFIAQNNYENQQPPSQYIEQQQQQQQQKEPEMSASRQKYGAFIQQLDEERRKRSASMIGLPISAPPPPPQQPLPLQNQQQNYDYGRDRYGGYAAIPPPTTAQPPPPEQLTQSSSNRYSVPYMYPPQQHELTQNNQWPTSIADERSPQVQQRQTVMSISVAPQTQSQKTSMMIEPTAYASPSINSSNDVPLRNGAVATSQARSKIPNLQERMYSLMRCVNSDSNNAPSQPSLSHWLVRDMAASSTAVNEDPQNKREDDQTSGTLTPGATPSKSDPQKTAPEKPSQVSPQYSQVLKKGPPDAPSQSSSMYVEHWLDAHASESSQGNNTVDNDPMPSPEPPRRVEDVFGKTRDELVLMLIQLRRRQAQGRYVDPTLYQIIEQQLAAERSVISLVDNVVAPYGSPESDTLRRQKNFERMNNERALVAGQLNQANDVDYESKQAIFWRLDEAVNRQTEVVTSLQEQHQQLIDAINVIRSRMTSNSSQIHQLTQLESSLHGIRASLATASRHLESLIFQRNQLEKQLQELKVRQVAANGPSRSVSVPSLQFLRPQQQQQTQQRFYPQPVVPVAPMQRQASEPPERSEVQSPVYATVRRYQNGGLQKPLSLLEPPPKPPQESTVLEQRPFSYAAPPKVEAQAQFKQPEPIYSKPLRFQPSQTVPQVQLTKQAQTPPIGVSRLASILSPANQNQPMHNAASMSMLSDAGSEATIDSLARQYTAPSGGTTSGLLSHNQQGEAANSSSLRQNSGGILSGNGGEDVELVDMVQRALAVVGEPGGEQPPNQPPPQQQQNSEPVRLSSVIAAKTTTTTRGSALPAIYNTSSTSAVPRRFSAHLRVPTPPPPENRKPQEDCLDFEVEAERFEQDVFGAPDKIEIPERYDPSADLADPNENDEEREQRSERYRQILLKQSLSNLTQEEAMQLSTKSQDLRSAIRQESQERHRLLRLSQTVAQQAKSASIHQASTRRSLPSLNPSDLPPSMPPPPPPQNETSPQQGQQQGEQASPETLWMEFGNREMAIDVC